MAVSDGLTGLPDMGAFLEQTGQMLSAAHPRSAVLYLNVESFGAYNRRYGFEAGDNLLADIASALCEAFPEGLVSRLSGDHFAVLTPAPDDASLTASVEALHQRVHDLQGAMTLELKCGVFVVGEGVHTRQGRSDAARILDGAKLACDSIHARYDQDLAFYTDDLAQASQLRSHVVLTFERALAEGWIQVYYQPEVRLLTGQQCGAEALARWCEPGRSMISPGVFVPVLEAAHLAHRLDLCVIERVCADMADLRGRGLPVQPVSVNLSRVDFQACDMFAEIGRIRRAHGVDASLLNIEITESAFAEDPALIGREISRFRAGGHQVWMDDFGSGYSSLNTLKDYDFDLLKIDMAFLHDSDRNAKARVIVAQTVDMAKRLGIHTLCEGVETEGQRDFLRSIGCERGQGYLFSKPLSGEDSLRRIQDGADTMESARRGRLLDAVGSANVLSDPTVDAAGGEESGGLAIALVELGRDSSIGVLYRNTAFTDLVSSLGMTAEETLAQLNGGRSRVGDFAHDLMQHCVASGQAEDGDVVVNGRMVNVRMRVLAQSAGSAAFAVVCTNLSLFQGASEMGGTKALEHVLSIFSRVDALTPEGEGRTLYLDTDQRSLSDVEDPVGDYARRYVAPGDQARFRAFFDFSTLEERCRPAKKAHVASRFRTRGDVSDYRLKQYLLIPCSVGGRRVVLSAVRNVDNEDGGGDW